MQHQVLISVTADVVLIETCEA